MPASSRALGLYRSLLRAHKKHLPSEMRALGDTYVKSEFQLHKQAKPEHLSNFFREWENYLDDLLVTARTQESLTSGAAVDESARAQTAEARTFGKDLPKDVQLQDEQRRQLEQLKREAVKLGKNNQ